MIKWLHHLFDPHCECCIEERRIGKECSACLTLQQQLEVSNHEKRFLLELISKMSNPESLPTSQVDMGNLKPIAPNKKPWPIVRAELEAESRRKAEVLRKNADDNGIDAEIEKLEEEVGIHEPERSAS